MRTFEAAAYLKQCGADTVEVRRLFNNNFDSYIKKYQIISNAEQPYPGVSISVMDEDTERATASQAADELININDIKASFVVFREHENDVAISARSYGTVSYTHLAGWKQSWYLPGGEWRCVESAGACDAGVCLCRVV